MTRTDDFAKLGPAERRQLLHDGSRPAERGQRHHNLVQRGDEGSADVEDKQETFTHNPHPGRPRAEDAPAQHDQRHAESGQLAEEEAHKRSRRQILGLGQHYLASRGLTEAEASTMIVSGFIEPLVKELPMEYAVEMNRLIELQMEGTVG